MQTNDFEKNVQQQMEKFTLSPTANVWLKVEERIRKEKKRRRIFFMWFIAGLLLVAAGGMHWYNKTPAAGNGLTNTTAYKIEEKKEVPYNKTNIHSGNTPDKDVQKHNVILENDPIPDDGNTKQTVRKHNDENLTGITAKTSSYKNASPTILRKGATLKHAGITPGEETQVLNNSRNIPAVDSDKFTSAINEPLAHTSTKDKELPVVIDTKDTGTAKTFNEEKIKTGEELASATTANSTDLLKQKSKSKWTFGLAITAGFSDNVNSLTILPGTKAMDVYSSPSQVGSSPGVIVLQDVTYKSSFSFGGGLFANRSLSKRWSLQAGINYHHYSVTTTVGQKVDSTRIFNDAMLNNTVSVGSFYRSGRSVSEKSSYYFVELPLSIQLAINKKEKHSFELFAGISPGVLAGSNALYYNRTTGIFYKETDQFRSLQLSLNTGFMYGLLTFSKYKVTFGPIIQYSLINLTTAAAKTDEHLFFTGLKANITLIK